VTGPATVAPSVGAVTATVGATLSTTVTATADEVVTLPAASRATAVSVWPPRLAVAASQLIEYGAVVSSAPRLTPSSLNCTPATPTSSLALAWTSTVVETFAPAAGAVSETAGAVVSFDVALKTTSTQ